MLGRIAERLINQPQGWGIIACTQLCRFYLPWIGEATAYASEDGDFSYGLNDS